MQVLNDEYLARYYKMQGSAGHSFHDLQLECMADPELSPFESRSIDMRILTGQTSLFQGVCLLPLSYVKLHLISTWCNQGLITVVHSDQLPMWVAGHGNSR